MQYRLSGLLVAVLCAGEALAQTSAVSPHQGQGNFAAPPPVNMRSVKTGAPYSADEVTGNVQTLADGTHITRTNAPTKVYRDSVGRTRKERPLFHGDAKAEASPDWPQVIEIVDPVAQFKYVLDVSGKVAHRQQLQVVEPEPRRRSGAIVKPAAQTGDEAKPQTNSEKLGTETIEGVLAEGTRTTFIYPTGSQNNDRPITVVTEMWMSPDLRVMVLDKHSDPRMGDFTMKLTNITRGDPPATLFQIPPDYTVVDEPGAFTLKY